MSIAEKLTTVADNQQKVYDAGKQAQYDAFWDVYQDFGNRTDYIGGFSGYGWTDEVFKPKYPIKLGAKAENVFQRSLISKIPEGVSIDTSGVTRANYMFYNMVNLVELPTLDFTNNTTMPYIFAWSTKLHTIEEIILSDLSILTNGQDAFAMCDALQNIKITGFFACDISFADSPLLTKDSIESIMSALSDITTEKTCTFNKTAIDNAYETSEGAADGSTSEDWLGYVSYKSNWNISLV